MIKYPYTPTDWVRCSCCGRDVLNTTEHNVALHKPDGDPYPDDDGYGMCVGCGGDPTADSKDLSEKNIRKRLGFGGECFYDTRIEHLGKALNAENSARFKALPFYKQVALVASAVEEGMIF